VRVLEEAGFDKADWIDEATARKVGFISAMLKNEIFIFD
jgi:hypothetical protein